MTRKRLFCCLALLAFAAGSDCTINISFDGDAPLTDAVAFITIDRADDEPDVTVLADITLGFAGLDLGDDQGIRVNGRELSATGPSGQYGAIIDAATQYLISVREPTRGIEETTVSPPPDFQITSPADGAAASLSGFVLQWSGADPALLVQVRLTQILLDDPLELDLGVFEDSGSVEITSAELQDAGFGQGADLIIELTKINEFDVAGFRSGTAHVRRTKSITIDPGP